MGCSSCASGGCSTSGCGNSGNCASGGCNRMNTFDWLVNLELPDADQIDIVEISFKNCFRTGKFKVTTYSFSCPNSELAILSIISL